MATLLLIFIERDAHSLNVVWVVVGVRIYPPVTGQRQTLNIGRSAHFSLH